jgi:hypothetical protein
MVFRTDNIRKNFKYKSTVSTPSSSSSQGPNRVSNVITNKINRPVTINQVATQKHTNSLSGVSLSISGGYDTNANRDDKFQPKDATSNVIPDAPMSTMADSKQFDIFKPNTWFGPPKKYNPNSAEAVTSRKLVLESNIITSKYPESTTPTNLKETASGTNFNSGTDLQGRQDAHAANLGIITSQPRLYTKGMEARGVSSNVSMGWNLESKPTGSTKSNSISSNLQFQANTKVHSGMVDTWQKGFLTSSSRDKTSASHWLNAQLDKIDSMQGTDRNKNMFKKDLQGRYDGLFGSSNSPFQSQQTLKHNNISDGQLRLADRKEAKRLQAVQARDGYFNSSSINNWMPSTVVPPQGPQGKKVTPAGDIQKTNLLSDFANGNF